jgi:TPR repeat protein
MEDIKKTIIKAKNGDIEAQFYMGKYYGDDRFRDDEKAFYWLKLAADQGHQTSQLWVGYSFEIGEGVSQDTKMALVYYEMAALQIFYPDGFLKFGQAKKNINNISMQELFYETTDYNVANSAYQVCLKYFEPYMLGGNFLWRDLPHINIGDSYLEIKKLFNDSIEKF